MRFLTKPVDKAEEVFDTCISRVRDNDLKTRLSSCKEKIKAAAKLYETKVIDAKLHTISETDTIDGIVTAKEMENVYTYRMANKDSPGRPIYDKLLAIPSFGRCPLCGQRIVTTLDHHLPKTSYPIYSIVPVNLIPACKDCNFVKLTYKPKKSEDETLHPYFDNVDFKQWLFAEVIETTPVIVTYYVAAPADWDDVLSKRIKNHFKTFELNKLYASHAAEELTNIRQSIERLFEAGGSDAVKEYLVESYISRKAVQQNSWQTALYTSISQNEWFYSNGFKL